MAKVIELPKQPIKAPKPEPVVMGQCGRKCTPDDCEAPECYQRRTRR